MKIKDLLEMDLPHQTCMTDSGCMELWNTAFSILEFFGKVYDIETEKLKDISIKVVYDVPHDSDESCFFYLVFLGGEFVATISKHGDRAETKLKFYNDGKTKLKEIYLTIRRGRRR